MENGTPLSAFFSQLSKEHAQALKAKEIDHVCAW